MNLVLTRDIAQPDAENCTLGMLTIPEMTIQAWQTMERPWVPCPDGACGMPGISCIQPGTYVLGPRNTPQKGDHWILSNPSLGVYESPDQVPAGQYGRSLVLIHSANWAHELKGCIAPGERRQKDTVGRWMVVQSVNAMNDLRALLGHAHHSITITGASP